MRHEDSPYWVDVTLEDEETEKKVREAILVCQVVHEWAMSEMQELWTYSSDQRVTHNDLVGEMTKHIKNLGLAGKAQRFSLVTALSRAIGRFNQEMVIDMVGFSRAEILFPDLHMPEAYKVLDVQSRSIWRSYMSHYNRFSTHYGGVYLEDEYKWRVTLGLQARKEGVLPETIHYLIYSATLREREGKWQAHFNFHKQSSKNGKKRLARA